MKNTNTGSSTPLHMNAGVTPLLYLYDVIYESPWDLLWIEVRWQRNSCTGQTAIILWGEFFTAAAGPLLVEVSKNSGRAAYATTKATPKQPLCKLPILFGWITPVLFCWHWSSEVVCGMWRGHRSEVGESPTSRTPSTLRQSVFRHALKKEKFQDLDLGSTL